MKAPMTMAEALSEIEALRGQLCNLLRPPGQEAEVDAADHRRRAESALRRSEWYFRALIENSSDIITVLDLDGKIQFESPSFERLLGYKQHELDGLIAFEFLHPDDLPLVLEKFQLVIERPGETQMAEFRFRHKDGSWLLLEGIGRSVLGLDGQRCVIVNSRDITERKRAEEHLRKSEARLKEAQRLARIGSWELDLTANHLSWSDEIYRIFGLARNSFGASYEAFLSAVHPDDRSAVDRAYTDSVRNKRPYEIVHRLLMPDGQVKYVQERGETVYDAQGVPQRSLGTVQDVTESVRLAQREAARREQLRKLSELGLTLSGDPAEISERIVRMIGELFEVRVVCLSEIVGSELRFKAVYRNGQVLRNAGRCPLSVMPCATVKMDKELRLFDRVMERFPLASFLKDHQAVSYCGFPALDAHGHVVAVTCLLDDRPREFTEEEQELLRVFGQRIAIEIERAGYLDDQKRHADELRRSHAFIRQIIDTTPNFIFAKDREGRFILANKAVADAYGTTVENLIGKRDTDFNPDRSEVEFFRQKDSEVMDLLEERFVPEEVITDAAGKRRWLQTVKRPIFDEKGHATMVLGASTDITERKQAEAALRQRERDLRLALEERERLSQDLHDGILQSLYAVGLGLESCKLLLRRRRPKRAVSAIEQAVGQLNQVMGELRNFIAGGGSQILQGADVATAMRAMVRNMSTTGISCRLTINKTASRCISTEQAFHLLNVTREALSNSLRHANATRISVSLKRLARSVRLSITDNGAGFDPAAACEVGRGLANMAARVRKMAGRLTVRSKLQRGTRIVVDLPEETAYAARQA